MTATGGFDDGNWR